MNNMTMKIEEIAESVITNSAKITVPNQGEVFSKLCERMTEKVIRESPIAEIDLNSFNKIAVYFMRNNNEVKSEWFEDLSRHITDYLRYKLKRETDLKRAFSYIRLSQTVNILYEFQSERDLEYKAHKTLKGNKKFADVIRIIKLAPGINTNRLQNVTSLLYDELCNQTLELEKRGLIVGNGIDKERYYILTKYGDAVYQNLFVENYNEWIDQWSDKRILVLYTFLKLCRNFKTDLLVQDVFRIISLQNEDEISESYDKIMNFKNGYQEKDFVYYNKSNIHSIKLNYFPDNLTQSLAYVFKPTNNISLYKTAILSEYSNKYSVNNEVQASIIQNTLKDSCD